MCYIVVPIFPSLPLSIFPSFPLPLVPSFLRSRAPLPQKELRLFYDTSIMPIPTTIASHLATPRLVAQLNTYFCWNTSPTTSGRSARIGVTAHS